MFSARLLPTIRHFQAVKCFHGYQPCQLLYSKVPRPVLRAPFSSSADDGEVNVLGPDKNLKKVRPGFPKLADDAKNEAADSSSSSSSDSDSEDSSSSDSDNELDTVKQSKSEELDPKLVSAVDAVADSLKGDKNKLKSDLLSQLQDHVKLVNKQKESLPQSSPIESVMSGLKVQSSRRRQDGHRKQDYKADNKRGRSRSSAPSQHQKGAKDHPFENFKLFQEPPLGIFSPKSSETPAAPVTRSIFDEIEMEELKHSMTYPPVNAFDEMITWTNEGKLWRYPIDNEQGLDEEAKVGFHEHVFLGHLLKDFPKKGPVRHFMELVTTGLSKNPYLTVSQKHEHVQWYKEYFKDKYELIDELTVVADEKKKQLNS